MNMKPDQKTVYTCLMEELRKKKHLHFTLIDPADQKPEAAAEIAKDAEDAGSDVIMVGGSTGASLLLNETCRAIKRTTGLPVILFPGNVDGVSPEADALLFMSLLNSGNPYWITGAQALAAPLVKKLGIETIPMGYLIVEPGGTVGWVGEARPIPRNKPELALCYSLAAELMGMKMVYLEAGSGAQQPVPVEMISMTKKLLSIPLIAGGGIRDGETASRIARAGADIVVTGTVVEESSDRREVIREIVDAIHEL